MADKHAVAGPGSIGIDDGSIARHGCGVPDDVAKEAGGTPTCSPP
jgi:hypothetical protein